MTDKYFSRKAEYEEFSIFHLEMSSILVIANKMRDNARQGVHYQNNIKASQFVFLEIIALLMNEINCLLIYNELSVNGGYFSSQSDVGTVRH